MNPDFKLRQLEKSDYNKGLIVLLGFFEIL